MEKKPIRIAQIMGKMNSGGVESVVMNYYLNINKDNIQFDFIIDKDSTNIPYEEIKNMGGKIILVPPYHKVVSYINSLKKIFKENNYEIVHSHLNVLSVFPLYAAKKSKIPIRIAHSHSTSNKKEWNKSIIKNILKRLSKINATHYFCCSELAGRWLFGNDCYDKGEVILINNAIDAEKFVHDEDIRIKIRNELGIRDDQVIFGHVGRFVHQKNHMGLIDIFYEIYKQNKDSVLLLIGEGPLLNKTKQKVNSLNLNSNVRFLGVRDDVNRLMQAMDVFLLPSLYEGLPVVGVEAQANGLLCVFSDLMTKETKVLDSTKFLSLNQNPKEWADLILKEHCKFEKFDTMDKIVEANFDIKTEVRKLEKKYISLIE